MRKMSSFSGTVGSRFLSLESVDYFGTSDYFNLVVEKKKNLNEQNFDGEAIWSDVVNVHCLQMSLVMSLRFIFGAD